MGDERTIGNIIDSRDVDTGDDVFIRKVRSHSLAKSEVCVSGETKSVIDWVAEIQGEGPSSMEFDRFIQISGCLLDHIGRQYDKAFEELEDLRDSEISLKEISDIDAIDEFLVIHELYISVLVPVLNTFNITYAYMQLPIAVENGDITNAEAESARNMLLNNEEVSKYCFVIGSETQRHEIYDYISGARNLGSHPRSNVLDAWCFCYTEGLRDVPELYEDLFFMKLPIAISRDFSSYASRHFSVEAYPDLSRNDLEGAVRRFYRFVSYYNRVSRIAPESPILYPVEASLTVLPAMFFGELCNLVAESELTGEWSEVSVIAAESLRLHFELFDTAGYLEDDRVLPAELKERSPKHRLREDLLVMIDVFASIADISLDEILLRCCAIFNYIPERVQSDFIQDLLGYKPSNAKADLRANSDKDTDEVLELSPEFERIEISSLFELLLQVQQPHIQRALESIIQLSLCNVDISRLIENPQEDLLPAGYCVGHVIAAELVGTFFERDHSSDDLFRRMFNVVPPELLPYFRDCLLVAFRKYDLEDGSFVDIIYDLDPMLVLIGSFAHASMLRKIVDELFGESGCVDYSCIERIFAFYDSNLRHQDAIPWSSQLSDRFAVVDSSDVDQSRLGRTEIYLVARDILTSLVTSHIVNTSRLEDFQPWADSIFNRRRNEIERILRFLSCIDLNRAVERRIPYTTCGSSGSSTEYLCSESLGDYVIACLLVLAKEHARITRKSSRRFVRQVGKIIRMVDLGIEEYSVISLQNLTGGRDNPRYQKYLEYCDRMGLRK